MASHTNYYLSIVKQLKHYLRIITEYEVFDAKAMKNKIDKLHKNVQRKVTYQIPSKLESRILAMISMYSKILYSLLLAKLTDDNGSYYSCKVDEEDEEVNESDSNNSSRLSLYGSDESDSEKRKSNRLMDRQVKVMEKWYLENLDNPYLNKDSTNILAMETLLSKTQLQNWYVKEQNHQ